MRFSIGIQPIKGYWLNCIYNMVFSILTSFEPSYRRAVFMNDYGYEVSTIVDDFPKIEFNCLIVKHMIRFKIEYYDKLFSSQPIIFKYEKNYVEFLKDLMKKKEFVSVGVDLFYWMPNNFLWNRNHWGHYSLLNGFDDEKKVFYALDENVDGYIEFEIPEERFIIAVANASLEPHGYIYKVSENIPLYRFCIEEVIDNAKRLKDELGTIERGNFWKLCDANFEGGDFCDLLSMYFSIIVNRHKANQILFQMIQNDIQNNKMMNCLIQYSQALEEGWILIKNIFLRTYFTDDKRSNVIEINEKCKDLLDKEYEMWDLFISHLEK